MLSALEGQGIVNLAPSIDIQVVPSYVIYLDSPPERELFLERFPLFINTVDFIIMFGVGIKSVLTLILAFKYPLALLLRVYIN